MLESTLQAKILKFLALQDDLFCFKAITTNKRGVPDIICCYKGKFIAFEVKRDTKCKASNLQDFQMWQIKNSGGSAFVVSSVEEVDSILKNVI